MFITATADTQRTERRLSQPNRTRQRSNTQTKNCRVFVSELCIIICLYSRAVIVNYAWNTRICVLFCVYFFHTHRTCSLSVLYYNGLYVYSVCLCAIWIHIHGVVCMYRDFKDQSVTSIPYLCIPYSFSSPAHCFLARRIHPEVRMERWWWSVQHKSHVRTTHSAVVFSRWHIGFSHMHS